VAAPLLQDIMCASLRGCLLRTCYAVLLLSLGFSAAQAQNAENAPQSMRFFITSAGSGKGGDLGGLAGADAHCRSLAAAVGAATRTWQAYLSTQATAGVSAVNARDRIGTGPWYNAKATLIARDLDELHGMNMLTKQTALTEKGAVVNGRGDTPNMHDILTGSQPDGKAFPPGNDMTCKNWTSSTVGTATRTRLDHPDGIHRSRCCRRLRGL
jgi:hypothetical protein